MERFYEDKDAFERQKTYVGKSMGEIMELEKEVFEKNKPDIDAKHGEYVHDRTTMLTVQKLIDYLKTQDPNACVLAYEPNSDAYIEQLPGLPNPDVENVAEAKKRMREDLKSWYRGTEDASKKIEDDIATVFRYAQDKDVIIRFN